MDLIGAQLLSENRKVSALHRIAVPTAGPTRCLTLWEAMVRVPTKRQCALIDQDQAIQRKTNGAVRTG
jgi:hypothetical protein